MRGRLSSLVIQNNIDERLSIANRHKFYWISYSLTVESNETSRSPNQSSIRIQNSQVLRRLKVGGSMGKLFAWSLNHHHFHDVSFVHVLSSPSGSGTFIHDPSTCSAPCPLGPRRSEVLRDGLRGLVEGSLKVGGAWRSDE